MFSWRLGTVFAGGSGQPVAHMVSEFDLPCTDCNQELVAREVSAPGVDASTSDALTVAECPSCGGRYYPEQALDRL